MACFPSPDSRALYLPTTAARRERFCQTKWNCEAVRLVAVTFANVT